VKLEKTLSLPDSFWKQMMTSEKNSNKLLMVYSKELDQVILFPINNGDHKVIKLICELKDISSTFIQEIVDAINHFNMDKIHITGVTINEEDSLIFEAYYSCPSVDSSHLEEKILSHGTITSCIIETVE
jgi:hypothetical protein